MSTDNNATPSRVVARDYQSDKGLNQVGVDCDSCDWELTIREIIDRIENSAVSRRTPKYIQQRFSSAGEGHAYFNRGHRISTHLSVDEIKTAVDRGGCDV